MSGFLLSMYNNTVSFLYYFDTHESMVAWEREGLLQEPFTL